jgi:hypothetical protein
VESDARAKARTEAQKLEGYSCCGNPCRYHEHLNEKEWRASMYYQMLRDM